MASITGTDQGIIRSFAVVLHVISCEQKIDSAAFSVSALELLKMFVEKYP
jgi:hypothetical protein